VETSTLLECIQKRIGGKKWVAERIGNFFQEFFYKEKKKRKTIFRRRSRAKYRFLV
jgi:hypothetical protein